MKMKSKVLAVMMVAMFMVMAVGVVDTESSDAAATVTLVVDIDPVASGVTITAVPHSSSHSTVTGTTDSTGKASLTLSTSTKWNVHGSSVGTTVSQQKTLEPSSSYSAYAMTLEYNERFLYTMNYNASAFASTGDTSLSYDGDAAGFTAVQNNASGLVDISDASWDTDNVFVSQCYYGVFNTDGILRGKLNPSNLTLYTTGASAATDITTCNVMWVVPTIYVSTTSTSITISNDCTVGGTAYAHTYNDHIYESMAYGVFEGTIVSGVLKSVSGSTPTASTTRAAFRTAAASNVIENGHAMLWNWDQYQLYKELTFFTIGGFDSQGSIGLGNTSGSAPSVTGQGNALGMFAGDVASGTNIAKCFIEGSWGSLFEWVDNCVYSGSYLWVGSSSTITDDTSNKVQTSATVGSGGWVSALTTDDRVFGMGTAFSGSSGTNGTFDYQYGSASVRAVSVGGAWSNGLSAGVSYVRYYAVTGSDTHIGARLAYVCDAAPASPVTTVNLTLDPNNGSSATVTTAVAGSTLSVPAEPTYTGHAFTGWYTSSACTTAWDWATVVSADLTLYAGWADGLVFTSSPTASVNVIPGTNIGAYVFSAFGSNGTSYEWDFGDGTAGTGLYAEHTYADSGTYTYALTVTNGQGTITYSDDLTVEIPVEPSGPSIACIAGIAIGALIAAAGLIWFRRPLIIVIGAAISIGSYTIGVVL